MVRASILHPGGLRASVSPLQEGLRASVAHPGELQASVSPPQAGSRPQFPNHTRAPGLNFPTPQRMPDGFDSVPLKTSSSSTDREL